MATIRFSLDEFKAALSKYNAESRGMIYGEESFLVKIDEQYFLSIRSSIGSSGIADSTGQDSIRLIPVSPQGKALGSQVMVTRVSGWDARVQGWIESFKSMHNQAGSCKVCGAMPTLQVSKDGPNKGKWFTKCDHNAFKWLNPKLDATKQQELPSPSEQVQSPTSALDVLDSLESSVSPSAPNKELRNLSMVSKIDYSILNNHQRYVVEQLCQGQYVVEAVPGSGKTRLVSYLVANMVTSGINPSEIACLTFSSKAATELRERIALTLWPDMSRVELDALNNKSSEGEDPVQGSRSWIESDACRTMLADWTCTIHGFCYRLLKLAGYKYKVLSGFLGTQANEIIKDSMAEFDWEDSAKVMSGYVAQAVLHDIDPRNAEEYFYSLMVQYQGPTAHACHMAEIYKRYVAFCERNNAIDFNMMIVKVAKLLRVSKSFLQLCQSKFKYFIIDEAQDTDHLQFNIFSTIAEVSKNIVFVGDVDQSMYEWRGASPDVMRETFEQKFKAVNFCSLPINYRSSKNIVARAAKLISSNYIDELVQRFKKNFVARDTAPEGDDIKMFVTEEIDELGQEISNVIMNDGNFGDWFVLSRTRAECAALHTSLIKNRIPAINLNGGLIFGSPHIRKVIAYLQLASNWHDARNSVEILSEIANVATKNFIAPMSRRRHVEGCDNTKSWVNCGCPVILEEGHDFSSTRFYGKKSIEEARGWSGIMLQMRERNKGGYPTLQSKGATDLVLFVDELEQMKDDAYSCTKHIIDTSVLPWLEHEEGIDNSDLADNGKQEDFNILVEMIRHGQTVDQLLDEIESISSSSKEGDENKSVIVCTYHKSKGAERKNVVCNFTRLPIIPPDNKPGKLPSGSAPTLEQERRIAYVGITRAKEQCYIVQATKWNGMDVPLSPFTYEFGMIE